MKLLACFLFLFVLALNSLAQQPPVYHHKIRGVIKTPNNEVINGLRLVFKRVTETRAGFTNIDGEFEVELPAGSYEAAIDPYSTYGFKLFVSITENGLNPDHLVLIVDPNLLCCQTKSGVAYPKPISLPKPRFPPTARAVGAIGIVIVIVAIDKTGQVTNAVAENGHPMLRPSATDAARNAMFETSTNDIPREAKIFYVFHQKDESKKGTLRYLNRYWVEVLAPTSEIIQFGGGHAKQHLPI